MLAYFFAKDTLRPLFILLICLLLGPVQRGQTAEGNEPVFHIAHFPSSQLPSNYIMVNHKPVLWVGDSVTQGWMECGDNFNTEDYLDALATRGMNMVMIWSYFGTDARTQIADERIGYDAPEVWPWMGSPDQRNFDLTRFNDRYFDRLKNLAALSLERNLTLLITVHDGGVKWRYPQHPFNRKLGNGPLAKGSQYVRLANYSGEMPNQYDLSWSWEAKNQFFQERFCDKLIEELRPYPNVIFELFNEGEWYDQNLRRRHEQHFLEFFDKRNAKFIASNADHIQGFDPNRDPLVDIISIHGPWTGRFAELERYFQQEPRKPILMSEPVPGWKGNDEFLSEIRRSVWETTLAGIGWVNQNDTSFGWDPAAKIHNKSAERNLAYQYVGICATFFNSGRVDFWRLRPDHNSASSGVCMTDRQNEFVVYAPRGDQLTLRMHEASGAFGVTWLNPSTGIYLSMDPVEGGAKRSFSPPSDQDWVLHLRKLPME